MRVIFKVAENPMETTTSTTNVKNGVDVVAVNIPRRVVPTADRKSDLLNVDNEKVGDYPSYLYPIRDVIEIDSNSVEHEKRSEDYDRHSNEVIKQASIMTSSAVRSLVSSVYSLLLTISVSAFLATKLWT